MDIDGFPEVPLVWLKLIVLPNVAPPLVLLLNSTSSFPGVSSIHTTYTLLPDTAIAGLDKNALVWLKLIVLPNVAPPSVLLLYNISKFPDDLSAHTTYTLFPDTAIAGTSENPPLLLISSGERLTISPAFVLYSISSFPDVSSVHTTCTASCDVSAAVTALSDILFVVIDPSTTAEYVYI
jgi:hypothetical protein